MKVNRILVSDCPRSKPATIAADTCVGINSLECAGPAALWPSAWQQSPDQSYFLLFDYGPKRRRAGALQGVALTHPLSDIMLFVMANFQHRLPENSPGDFFVDATCIDCDTCSQLAPSVFHDHGEQCSVYHQPGTEAETRLALMALVACPTGSIGTTERHNARIGIDAFPSLIAENVYFCGFTSEASFGAWSYLIVRPASAGGNLLIDSPRFATQLIKRIDRLGGVKRLLLTHRDDVADHKLFAGKFGCERVMHADDGAGKIGAEHVITGEEDVWLDRDLVAIPTPGHTRGHVVFLYKNKFLFTGDHLAWSVSRRTLTAFPTVAWYSWTRQTESMSKLLNHDFEWILPGHGDLHQDTVEMMRYHLQSCITWMKTR